LVILNDFERP